MKIITESSLASMLETFTGAQFVSVVTETEPKMNKKSRVSKEPNPYLGRVKRMAVRAGMLGASYEKAVTNRRESEEHPEPVFTAEALWNGKGEHVNGSKCLVRHRETGKLYMVFYPKHDDTGTVKVSESEWLCDGAPIDVAELQPYLPPVSEGSARQETERPVPWRVIGLDGIRSLTMAGETYTVAR